MQRGYVFCNDTHDEILCFSEDRKGFIFEKIKGGPSLNRAICLGNLTEAKNIKTRIINKQLLDDLEIINIAALYKKIY